MRREDVEDAPNVVNRIFSIRTHPIEVLVDSSTTHSFVSAKLVVTLGLVPVSKHSVLPVALHDGKKIRCDGLYKDCLV